MIIDGANTYVRCWAAYPTMSVNGYQMGGCVGFLKSLRKLVSEQQPAAVYVAWESGGSARRRKIFPEYKMGRRMERLNRFYEDDIPDTDDNRKHQLLTLLTMLKHVPVCQLYASDCEGDDLVAYLCRGPFFHRKKTIVSSDRDMFQLLDDDTTLYSMQKKGFVTQDDVLEQFGSRAHNFSIAKSLCGDKGDNVPGIKGLGFKTAAKLYPLLGSEEQLILQDVIDYAASHINESAFHRRVVENQDLIRRNHRLVHLDGSMLSATQINAIDQAIQAYKPKSDRMGLIKLLAKEGVGDFDVDWFYYTFSCIDGLSH